MNKKTLVTLTLCSVLLLATSIGSKAASAPGEDLTTADWSVNAARNLASNPPSLDAVKDFENNFWGVRDVPGTDKVCEFRFADLRKSGNLSLIASVAPGSWGCTELYIFDKTATGFELYSPDLADGPVGHDLAHSILDLNHDGRHELVLWQVLAPYATGYVRGRIGCEPKWPLIFAWSGDTYSDVSNHYKDYYAGYLKIVNARLDAFPLALASDSVPTSNVAPMHNSVKILGQTEVGTVPALEAAKAPPSGPAPTKADIPTTDWAVRNLAQRDYPCTRIEAAKTEAFLGIDSSSTMNAAIKDSESDDPKKRLVAAVIFSFFGTHEAEQDLKTLSSDSDPRVAAIAKTAASFGRTPFRALAQCAGKIPTST